LANVQVAQLASEFFLIVSPVRAFIGVGNVNELLALENAKQQRLNLLKTSCEPANVK
jgi:hypothetical protein